MKNMKKVLALLVAVLMIAASMSALADDPTIKITAPAGHTYEVYQVFTGEVDGQTLTSLKYGRNTSRGAAQVGKAVSQTDMETLAALTAGTDVQGSAAQTLIDTLEGFVTFSNPVATVASATATEGLEPGYYVIRDKIDALPETDGATLYMFQVLGANLEIAAKSDKPSSDKKVDDTNDSTGVDQLLQTSADYEIGDHVPYTLTATLPTDYANYEHYYLKFYDDMSKGLTYDEGSAQIAYGSADAVAFKDPTAGTTTYPDGHMWTWEIIDLKAVASGLAAGDTITLTYTATLNASAEVGLPGNPNKHYIEFSSNPNNTGDGSSKPDDTGKTPVDITFVLTYETIFNKVDQDQNPLTGADFELLKFVEGEGEDTYGGKTGTWTNVTALGQEDIHPTKVVTDNGDIEDAIFTFKGIDDGVYKLHETQTPTGYNTIADIIFTVTADHNVVSEQATLTLSGTDANSTNPITFTAVEADGSLSADVVNKSGVTLPSTGGIGTTIFYVGGSILVLAAVILLVTKRRMNAEK